MTPLLPDPEAERVLGVDPGGGVGGPARARHARVSAKRLAAKGNWREALDGMLGSLTDERDDAREAMVDAFAVLGDDDPLVPEFRKRLSNALF